MTAVAITSKISAEKKTLFFGSDALAAAYKSTIDKSNSALICIAVKPSLIGGALAPFLDQVKALGTEIELTSLDEVPAFFARENVVALGRPKSDVEKSVFQKKVLLISGVANADESQLAEVTRFLDEGHSLSYNTVISVQLDRPIRVMSAWEKVFPNCTWWFSSESVVQLPAAGALRDSYSADQSSSFDTKPDPTMGHVDDLILSNGKRGLPEVGERGTAIRSRISLRPTVQVVLFICVCVGVALGIWRRNEPSRQDANTEPKPAVSISAVKQVEKAEPGVEPSLAQPSSSESVELALPQSTQETVQAAPEAPEIVDPQNIRSFYLQFGRFQNKQNADDYRLVLLNKGIRSAVVFTQDRGVGRYVVLSASASLGEIRTLQEAVRKKGVDAIVKVDGASSKK